MAKSVASKKRTLSIMEALLEKSDEAHRLSTNDLLEMLEREGISTNRKSIYDDIETLKEWGMDILYTKEKPAGYYVGSRKFELPELKLLVDAVQSSKFITVKKSRKLIKKLESLASVSEAKQLQRNVYITNRNKTLNESIYYNVDKIHDAILSDAKIRFVYYKWNTDKELIPRNNGNPFVVSPWALTWDDENYYLIGYDSDAEQIRHYRVDKMLRIQMSKEDREGREHFKKLDMADYARKSFGMFRGEEQQVKLLVNNRMAGVIIDRFGKEVMMIPADADHFRVSVDVHVSPQFLSWIISLGDDVKIIGPEDVVERMREEIRRLSRQYGE